MAHRAQRNMVLTRFQVYYKGYNSGTANWKRLRQERVVDFHALFESPSPQISMCPQPRSSPSSTLEGSEGDTITDKWLIKSLVTASIFSFYLLPRGQEMGLKIPTLQSHGWLHWQWAPSLSCFPKVPSLIEKTPLSIFTGLGNSKGLESCESEIMDTKTKFI